MLFCSKSVAARPVVTLCIGLVLGILFGLFIPFVLSSHSEQIVSHNELTARSQAEEAVRLASLEKTEEPGFSYLSRSGVQKYDGPRLAESMPIETKEAWMSWMKKNRNDDPAFLEQRWKWAQDLVISSELKRPEDVRAFLLTPREHFVRAHNKGLEYADTWLPIGYGATITDPDVVSMMTTTLNLKPGEKVLEIGTGSGYQSALLSYLTKDVYTIEIIKPLFIETDAIYKQWDTTFPSYTSINRKLGDGYYGWDEFAPFDKIIVTCAIDHIPPPLLQQLNPGGIMVLPLGPPGRQYIMEVKKNVAEDGTVTLSRRDVYNGMSVRFIPFTNERGSSYSAPASEEPKL